jgi:hypothetical protein
MTMILLGSLEGVVLLLAVHVFALVARFDRCVWLAAVMSRGGLWVIVIMVFAQVISNYSGTSWQVFCLV